MQLSTTCKRKIKQSVAQSVSEQQICLLAHFPSYIWRMALYGREHLNIPLASLGQLSWLCSPNFLCTWQSARS